MNTINLRRFRFAFDITCALLYIGSILVMVIFGHDNAVIFFNTLLHGFDVSSILRTNIPLQEVLGIALMFIVSWLTGTSIALVYNFASNRKLIPLIF